MYALRDFGSFHAGGRIVSVAGKEKRMIRFTADMAHEYDPNGDFLRAELIELPAVGFPGSSHMFMMDEHSAWLSEWLGAWIRENC